MDSPGHRFDKFMTRGNCMAKKLPNDFRRTKLSSGLEYRQHSFWELAASISRVVRISRLKERWSEKALPKLW